MTDQRPATDFEIVGELGQTGEGPTYLARNKSTHELVAVRPADESGTALAVMETLNSDVPAADRNCPICRVAINDWRRFCDQCGADLSGVDIALEGLDARRVVEEVLESSDRSVDLLGPIKRSEGGGDVWFGRNRRTGEILAIDLTRGDPARGSAGPFDIAVTSISPAHGPVDAAGPSPGPTHGQVDAPEPPHIPAHDQADAAPATPAGEGAIAAAPVKICPSCGKSYSAAVRFCPDDGSVLRMVDAPDSMVGDIIANRYLVIRKLGQGGMGHVYLAEHVRMGRQCAIKVLSRELSNDVDAVSRFAREATNASRINDIHVAHTYDFGETPEHGVYLAMEYVEGEPLAKLIAADGPFSDERAIAIAVQVAGALKAAHAVGVVHRDLTPNNIMIGRARDGSDMVKVVDFGIAKATEDLSGGLTRTGYVVGTPQYMSPEQLLAEPVDGRSDVYQLGCVMYEMLVGEPPFGRLAGPQQITTRLTGAPPSPIDKNPSVSTALSDIVVRALARSRDERYQSAVEIQGTLNEAVTGHSVSEPLPPDEEPAPAEETFEGGVASETETERDTEQPETGAGPQSESRTGPDQPIAGPPVDHEPETMLQESPARPPRLSRPRAGASGRARKTGAGKADRTSRRSGPAAAPGTGPRRSPPLAPTGIEEVEDATLVMPAPERAGGAPDRAEREHLGAKASGWVASAVELARKQRKGLLAGTLGAAGLLVVAVAYGTVVSPIRLGPITLGFGQSSLPSPPAQGPVDPGVPAIDPNATAQTEQSASVPAEPSGIRFGAALPPAAIVQIDGSQVAVDDDFIGLVPGDYEIEILAAGFLPVRNRVTIRDAETFRWTPQFDEVETAAPAPPIQPETTSRADSVPQLSTQTTTPPVAAPTAEVPVPASFADAANEGIDEFRQSLESKNLASIRTLLVDSQVVAFQNVLDAAGAGAIDVSVFGVETDSTGMRAMFFLRIDQGDNVLMDVKEFVAEFLQIDDVLKLWLVQGKE